MIVSDDDFFIFYQNFLATLVTEGDGDVMFTTNYFSENEEEGVWHEKVLAALIRLGVSGLIYCGEVESEFRFYLKRMFLNRDEDTWFAHFFIPTEAGVELAEKFLIYFNEENRLRVITNICEEFREELERIFDGHGVGFDVDLPYDRLLSLDSE